MAIAQESRESDCTFLPQLSRAFPKMMLWLAFILIAAIPSLAGAAIVSTDQPEYAPGDSVIIYGSGFWSGETVTVQVTHDDGTPPGGLGHEPWNVVANAGGDFETYWIVPGDDNVDEVLRVTATGQSSGDQATTTFLDANTILTLEPYPDSLCPNTGGDSLDVCAVLEEQCGGSGFAPLEGRPLIFFFNDGNCGVDVAQTGEDTVLTDSTGRACGRLAIPSIPGDYALRVKFLGEAKPADGDPPNSACDPSARVTLSNANVCEPITVDPAACNEPPTASCHADTTVLLCDLGEVCIDGFSGYDSDGSIVSYDVSPGTYNAGTVCFTPTGPGTYTITFIVTDDDGDSDTCYTDVTVNVNSAPVCSVPSNQTFFQCIPTEVCLPVSCSDADGNLTASSPTIVSGPGTITGGNWCYTPTASGPVTVTVRCEDDCGAFCESSFTITFDLNDAPVCSVPANQTIFQCTPAEVCLPVSCADADGNLSVGSPSIVSGPGTISNGNWYYTPTVSGPVTVTVRCEDNCGAYCESSFTITFDLNDVPVCTVPESQTIVQCTPAEVCLPVSCTDQDGNLTAGSPSIVSGPGTISNGNWCYTPTASGPVTVIVRCEDDCGAYCESSFTITFDVNSPPVCSVPEDQTIFQCTPEEVCLPVSCSDPDGDLAAGSPSIADGPGTIINGNWCYTPTESGPVTVTVRCEDECGAFCESSFTITFDLNDAPVCTVPASQTIVQCAPAEVCLPVSCSDADGNLTQGSPSIVSGPGQITNGNWCYTPTGSEQVTVTVRCEDECGAFCESSFTIAFEVNQPPVCTVPDDQTISQCEPTQVCLPVSCADPDDNLTQGSPSIVSGPGQISDGNWCYTPTGSGPVTVTVRCEDECGASCESSFTITFDINSPPVCIVPDDRTFSQCEPTEVCLPVSCSDPDGNLDASSPVIVSGPGQITNGNWCYTPSAGGTVAVTVQCTDQCGATCQSTFNITFELNRPPVVTCPNDTTVHWGQTVTRTATASDPDGQAVTFSLGSGSPGSINSNTGAYSWTTTGEDVCEAEITVVAMDPCGGADSCTFTICVQNSPPVVTCPDSVFHVCAGSGVSGRVSGVDPDQGPNNLVYSVASFDGPGTVNLDPVTGDFSWETTGDPEYAGTFNLCIEASDGAETCSPCSPSNADTCCISIRVTPVYQVHIEKTHGTLQGQVASVQVYLDSSVIVSDMGGFSFLITYDASALSPIGVLPGQFITDCGWEYFTYRCGAQGNCGGSACPTGEIRITAIAETNNGANHPLCLNNEGVSSQLAVIQFLVSNDRNLSCSFVPLRFHWYECADNTISSTTGDTLFMASAVYDWRGSDGADAWYEITDPFEGFPGYGGPPDSCLEGESPDKPAPIRCLEFYNGGIDIICSDSIDARGDINLDGLPYTISDAVMFSNYFVHGLSAFVDVQQTNMYGFAPGYEGSIAATDVNADGIPLSVSDLVYLIRVIVGDAAAYPKVTPVHVDLQSDGGVLSVCEDMGAAYVVVAGDVTPHLLADRVEMKHNFDGERTHVLVYSLDGLSFSGRFLEVDGPIISIEMATAKGQPATINLVPVTFELGQNFPNPFNPTTQIEFNLPEATQVNLTVFNVQGQKVTTLVDGYLDAGPHTVTWDAGDNASGMYFYRLQAGDFVQSKKMLLLK